MVEYINKEAAYDYATLDSWYIASVTNGTPIWTEEHLEELLNDFYVIPKDTPAADVVEVKHGKWYRHDKKIYGDTCYHCSECERMPLTDCGMVWELTPYCPFCGAKMDGGKNGEKIDG